MRPSAGQLRFCFRFWQRGQTTRKLYTPLRRAAISGNFRLSRAPRGLRVSIDQQSVEKSTTPPLDRLA
jgi:hypothetical protein